MDPKRRAYWLKSLHRWHWISAALSLVAILLFAATGITLNHAGRIEGKPRVETAKAQLPADLLRGLEGHAAKDAAPLPETVRNWIRATLAVTVGERSAEWSADEAYVSLPRPGGDAWLSIDLGSGEVHYEKTDRGWIAYLNDLHKGRNTGPLWSWFIDLFAVACLVFAATGLILMQLHARQRPATWPVVAFGLVLPLLIAILSIH